MKKIAKSTNSHCNFLYAHNSFYGKGNSMTLSNDLLKDHLNHLISIQLYNFNFNILFKSQSTKSDIFSGIDVGIWVVVSKNISNLKLWVVNRRSQQKYCCEEVRVGWIILFSKDRDRMKKNRFNIMWKMKCARLEQDSTITAGNQIVRYTTNSTFNQSCIQ
jgi:hypothetical protein